MGPLTGVRVLEFEAVGPGPFCGMLLADMGADVLLVDRAQDARLGLGRERWYDVMMRGRRSVTLDLKTPDGVTAALALASRADAVIEGFRPGVMERLGFGPDALLAANAKLVYGRMTGWGQDGPLALRAGHDINYIALSGALHAIGRADGPPVPPLNLVGDFGGGGMLPGVRDRLRVVRGAPFRSGASGGRGDGRGRIAPHDDVLGHAGGARWNDVRGTNVLDSGAPWYDTYATKDQRYVAIGALEPKFYAELLERLGLADAALPDQNDRAGWPALRARFAAVFATKTRDEWCRAFEGSDACFAPVLTFTEATRHPHLAARHAHVAVGAITQPAPAPRFSRTPGAVRRPPPERGALGREALAEWGFADDEIERLRALGMGFRD